MTKIHCDGYKGWWETCPTVPVTVTPDLSLPALIVGAVVFIVIFTLFMQMIVWSTE